MTSIIWILKAALSYQKVAAWTGWVIFQHAHPILPVVNEAEFWSAYDPSTSGGKTSRVPFMLLLAILFVACKVSPQHITAKLYTNFV